MIKTSLRTLVITSMALVVGACGTDAANAHSEPSAAAVRDQGPVAVVTDTLLPTLLSLSGTAAPVREATLSTKLMASVTAVLVKEGDVVASGALLARLDARDLDAKAAQVAASSGAVEAMHAQAAAHAARMRKLFDEGAAPKATLEAAEASLAQAEAGLAATRAAAAELAAVGSYAEVRAPFAGRVTRRFVDPGAFAAPGAPLLTVQDASSLRITVHATPTSVRALRRGQELAVLIEGEPAEAMIEGIVPGVGSLHAVNAIVANPRGTHLAGSAATLLVPAGTHRALAIPEDALRREGDLVGVTVRTDAGDVRRWIRVGAQAGTLVEVTAGLRAGEQVVRQAAPASAPTGGAN